LKFGKKGNKLLDMESGIFIKFKKMTSNASQTIEK
jgi:hypothetical protein